MLFAHCGYYGNTVSNIPSGIPGFSASLLYWNVDATLGGSDFGNQIPGNLVDGSAITGVVTADGSSLEAFNQLPGQTVDRPGYSMAFMNIPSMRAPLLPSAGLSVIGFGALSSPGLFSFPRGADSKVSAMFDFAGSGLSSGTTFDLAIYWVDSIAQTTLRSSEALRVFLT